MKNFSCMDISPHSSSDQLHPTNIGQLTRIICICYLWAASSVLSVIHPVTDENARWFFCVIYMLETPQNNADARTDGRADSTFHRAAINIYIIIISYNRLHTIQRLSKNTSHLCHEREAHLMYLKWIEVRKFLMLAYYNTWLGHEWLK